MRGEYSIADAELLERLELPPRARRILLDDFPWGSTNGTTSACAENTFAIRWGNNTNRNYLRVRGEYPYYNNPRPRPQGTTSACAENTVRILSPAD